MPEQTPAEKWKAQIEASRKRREQLIKGPWQTNVQFRMQRPFSQSSDDEAEASHADQIAVPADWSRTRAKQAALFSSMPRISLGASQARYAGAVPTFEKIVNHFAPLSGLMATMEECSADVVNACGVCAAMMKYEATFEEVLVPQTAPGMSMPPMPGAPMAPPAAPPGMMPQPQQMQQANGAIGDTLPPPDIAPSMTAASAPPMAPLAMLLPPPPPMVPMSRTVSERYRAYRISPACLLWPTDFRGSDWQRARWLGYDGTMPWAQAKNEFKLDDDDKRDVCGETGTTGLNVTLAGDINSDTDKNEVVHFTELFYWAHLCDPEEKRYEAIRRCVFVKGKDEPVIDEEYAGQTWVADKHEFVGCTRLPIEVTTLTYISDRAVPPSDSEIGRPMVYEQMRSRSQMIMQRTRNLPLRTADVNRMDPTILDALMRGTWQGIIPVNGPGERVISQVAAAAFPREDFEFDRVSNRDLDDAWSMSPNQMGTFFGGERSATEASQIASAYASVIGFQRSKIIGMFLGLVSTLMGLLQLNLDDYEAEPIVGPDGVKRLQQWDRQQISGKFVAEVRQDSSVLQDAGMRTQQLMKYLNIAGKSGRVNIDPILAELAALSGLDPSTALLPPSQPKTEPPNISYRFSGVADLIYPISVALLNKKDASPLTPQDIEAAKQMILDAMGPPKQMPPPQPGTMPGQQPALPPWQAQQLLIAQSQQPQPSEPDPDWNAMPRVSKRPFEAGG